MTENFMRGSRTTVVLVAGRGRRVGGSRSLGCAGWTQARAPTSAGSGGTSESG
jgi:hypothetical protein